MHTIKFITSYLFMSAIFLLDGRYPGMFLQTGISALPEIDLFQLFMQLGFAALFIWQYLDIRKDVKAEREAWQKREADWANQRERFVTALTEHTESLDKLIDRVSDPARK